MYYTYFYFAGKTFHTQIGSKRKFTGCTASLLLTSITANSFKSCSFIGLLKPSKINMSRCTELNRDVTRYYILRFDGINVWNRRMRTRRKVELSSSHFPTDGRILTFFHNLLFYGRLNLFYRYLYISYNWLNRKKWYKTKITKNTFSFLISIWYTITRVGQKNPLII